MRMICSRVQPAGSRNRDGCCGIPATHHDPGLLTVRFLHMQVPRRLQKFVLPDGRAAELLGEVARAGQEPQDLEAGLVFKTQVIHDLGIAYTSRIHSISKYFSFWFSARRTMASFEWR